MDIISVVEMNQIYWLGRYTERVFTTIRHYFSGRDHMIEDPDYYITYCRDFTIPNCYASAEDFLVNYVYDEKNPDSIISNLNRAYDNAIVLRNTLGTETLSYMELAVDQLNNTKSGRVDLLAFWGGADDYVEGEDCRNILKCGKYVERLDLCIRLDYHTKDLEKEYRKLCNRIEKTSLNYHRERLERVGEIILREEDPKLHYREALGCLGGLFF